MLLHVCVRHEMLAISMYITTSVTPGYMQSHLLCRTCFGQYQASSVVLYTLEVFHFSINWRE